MSSDTWIFTHDYYGKYGSSMTYSMWQGHPNRLEGYERPKVVYYESNPPEGFLERIRICCALHNAPMVEIKIGEVWN